MSGPAGPISVAELKSLAELPHGEAASRLRQHDPLYGKGLPSGPMRSWKVRLSKEVTMVGTLTIEAASEEEAELLAQNIDDSKVSWTVGGTHGESIEDVSLLGSQAKRFR